MGDFIEQPHSGHASELDTSTVYPHLGHIIICGLRHVMEYLFDDYGVACDCPVSWGTSHANNNELILHFARRFAT